jgi:hypothetical protein
MSGIDPKRSFGTARQGQKQTCTRNVGRVIALSVEPFYDPGGRSIIGL